jgi:hypothetical protein
MGRWVMSPVNADRVTILLYLDNFSNQEPLGYNMCLSLVLDWWLAS